MVRTGDVGYSERTQVIRSSPSYQRRPEEIRDLFQPVETYSDEPVNKPGDPSAPPWTDPPPLAEQQSAWLRQATKGFETSVAQSRSKQIIGITVLAVVVLGLVGATVAYCLTAGPGRTGSDQIAAAAPAATPRELRDPPAPLPAPVDTAHALIDPPGQVRGGGGVFDLARLESENLLPRSILNSLQAGGMTDGVLKTTTAGVNTIGMFALTMPDQQTATTVAKAIATTQLEGGLKPDDNRALQGVEVMGSAPGSDSPVYRAVYVLYNRVIYFEVLGVDRDAVLATFDSLIKQQVNYAPPTVRVGR